MKLKSLSVIASQDRISSIDIFRGFAILPVVLFHFHEYLPFGLLGVDLFFVISGFLVGSILIKQYKTNNEINFFRFVLQRGFKIWPSYYSFLVAGSILAFLLYRYDKPEFLIAWESKDAFRYLFFYQNYTGAPFHWIFNHVWSLCVEEHFYILLPLMIILVKGIFGNKKSLLFLSVAGLILGGIVFKELSILYTHSKDTYAGTHNRIDALGWGVLLGIIISYYGDNCKKAKWRPPFLFSG